MPNTTQGLWNTLLEEYENNPEWFKDLIWPDIEKVINRKESTQTADKPYRKMPGFESPEAMLAEYPGLFRAFNPNEWVAIDEMSEIQLGNMQDNIDLQEEQRSMLKPVEFGTYEAQKDARISEADLLLENTLEKTDRDKALLREEALANLSQLDSLVASSGISSGDFSRKRQIEEDNIAASIHQANFNRVVATKKANVDKTRAESNYSQAVDSSNLKFDIAYDTAMTNMETKQNTLFMDKAEGKINVYNAWHKQQVQNANQIMGESFREYCSPTYDENGNCNFCCPSGDYMSDDAPPGAPMKDPDWIAEEEGGTSFICGAIKETGTMSFKDSLFMMKFLVKSSITHPLETFWYITTGKFIVDTAKQHNFDFSKKEVKEKFVDNVIALEREGKHLEALRLYYSSLVEIATELGMAIVVPMPGEKTSLIDRMRGYLKILRHKPTWLVGSTYLKTLFRFRKIAFSKKTRGNHAT